MVERRMLYKLVSVKDERYFSVWTNNVPHWTKRAILPYKRNLRLFWREYSTKFWTHANKDCWERYKAGLFCFTEPPPALYFQRFLKRNYGKMVELWAVEATDWIRGPSCVFTVPSPVFLTITGTWLAMSLQAPEDTVVSRSVRLDHRVAT